MYFLSILVRLAFLSIIAQRCFKEKKTDVP